jgi:predicted transcriptional regulator
MEGAKFESILMRVASVTKSIKPKDLASILEITPAAVSKALTKKQIPATWVNKLTTKYNLTHRWLMFGDGSENEDFVEAGPITEQKHSMHLTLTKKGEEKLMEIYGKLVESQEREIEALKEQVASLKAENAELKRRLSLSPTVPDVAAQANTA